MSFLFKRNGAAANYQHLTIDEYESQYLNAQTDHVLVDVRTAAEFAGGHLPDAINLPLDQLNRLTGQIPAGKPVVVVCATGNRSQGGADIIAKAGFDPVYNLKGGTLAWMMSGRTITA